MSGLVFFCVALNAVVAVSMVVGIIIGQTQVIPGVAVLLFAQINFAASLRLLWKEVHDN